MPFIFRMSGWLYLVVAVGLSVGFSSAGMAAQLLRCLGTQDISVFFNSPVGAVWRAAGGSLLVIDGEPNDVTSTDFSRRRYGAESCPGDDRDADCGWPPVNLFADQTA
jgi:hypothetical protein